MKFCTLESKVRKAEKAVIVDGYISPDWIVSWSALWWADDVQIELQKAQLWCEDMAESDPTRLPTRRGLRAFAGNWLRRSNARLKPQIRMVTQKEETKPEVPRETINKYLNKMKNREKV